MSEILHTPGESVDDTTTGRPGLVQVSVSPRLPASKRAANPRVDAARVTRIREQGYRRRKTTNAAMLGFAVVCAVAAIIPLFAIAIYVVAQGVSSLDLSFFTHAQSDVNTFGVPIGIGNTIVGSLLLVVIACAIGLPIGLFSGIYLAEYGRGRVANAVRFTADVIAGLPSIIAGLVSYALIVPLIAKIPNHNGFSAIAGGFALALLMFPVVTRSTEEVLRLVPNSLREAGLALGIPRWRVIASVVLPTAASGIVTSMLLGVARATGETAPLLFTSFGNNNWNWDPTQPIGALPQIIYQYSTGAPNPQQQHQAFAGALVLVAIVVLLNLIARVIFRQRVQGRT